MICAEDIKWRSSLASCMDCDMKARLFLLNQQDGGGGDFGDAINVGIFLHECAEKFLKDQEFDPYHPTLPVGDRWKRVLPVLENLKPILAGVEKPMRREAGAFIATGRFDAIDEEDWFYDWKFVGRPWTAQRMLSYVEKQGDLYLWLGEEYLGRPPAGLKYVVVPEKGPVDTWTLRWDEDRINKSFNLWYVQFQSLLCNARMNSWHPSPTPFKCKWCLFRKQCEHSAHI